MDAVSRPRFSDLTLDQQALFGNGLGPEWMPVSWRAFVTEKASWFFNEASWRHHDFGYYIGHTWRHRFEYDCKFLRAMISDAFDQEGLHVKIVPAIVMALVIFTIVALFGWSSFHFAPRYRTSGEAAIASVIKSTEMGTTNTIVSN